MSVVGTYCRQTSVLMVMFNSEWYRFHPLTCAAMLVAIVVLGFLNSRCHFFFGAGSTTVLRFGHGWPFHFQEAPVPSPGNRGPNYIWGHPEFNEDPEIMAKYIGRLEGLPRTPWGLRSLAKASVFGAVFDASVALVVLIVVSFLCEVVIRNASRQAESAYPILAFVVVIAVCAVATSAFVQATWVFVAPAVAVVLTSIVITGVVLSIGYR